MTRLVYLFFTFATMLTIMGACSKKEAQPGDVQMKSTDEIEIKGDSMLYGLACDGTSDSTIVIWPFKGDPIAYNAIDAKQQGKIIGRPQIGDWIGVMISKEDTSEITMAVNLDMLKGTWTYPVMPVMKELQNMSKRMQKRMMENMPDSVKNTFFIPREYGFTLKRGHVAQAVGRVRRSNTLTDDSPVQYPEVRNYKNWYTLNGRLILVSGIPALPGIDIKDKRPDVIDTLDFVYMDEDSLILTQHGNRYNFHRKENATQANAAATKAQEKQERRK